MEEAVWLTIKHFIDSGNIYMCINYYYYCLFNTLYVCCYDILLYIMQKCASNNVQQGKIFIS